MPKKIQVRIICALFNVLFSTYFFLHNLILTELHFGANRYNMSSGDAVKIALQNLGSVVMGKIYLWLKKCTVCQSGTMSL